MTRLSDAFTKARPAVFTFITAGDGYTAVNLDAIVADGKGIFTVAEALGTVT